MNIIVNVDNKWGIGKNNNLLFHIKQDLQFFKENTLGKVVVMGYNTLLSLPNSKPLKNRTNIVLCADGIEGEGYIMVDTVDKLLNELKKYNSEDIYIIGGASVYKLMLPYCDRCIVTKVDKDGEAEVFFPNLDEMEEWKIKGESEKYIENDLTFKYVEYVK